MKQGLPFNVACDEAHKLGAYIVASNIKKRQVQMLNKLQGSTSAPDAVEIFNEKLGGYRDLDIDFPKVISSGSTSANELEQSNVFTLLERKKAEEIGLLQKDEGVDFVPKYLQKKTEEAL